LLLSPILEEKQWKKKEINFKKDFTPQRFGTFSAIFLRVIETSQNRAFFARSTHQR
jgi:hypothetical protein